MNTKLLNSDICALVVVYNPNLDLLHNNIKYLTENFFKIFLINNSPDVCLNSLLGKKVDVITNRANVGLAKALNKGIFHAKKHKFKFVALFDQDTLVGKSFNKKMISNINIHFDNNIALYSPVCFNNNTNDFLPLYYVYPLRIKRIKFSLNKKIYKPDFVITSGSYISLDSFKSIGVMDENLFINYIDIEWCLRARSKGYQIVSFSDCQIEHNIGDYAIRVLNRKYPIHSPLRMYYTFRNALYCYSLKHVSFSWKLTDFFRNVPRFLFYMLFVKNRWTYFRYITKGYYHGLIKKMGKLEE